MKSVLLPLTLVSLGQLALASNYTLLKDHSGTAFFDDWDFYGNYDNLTNGAHPVYFLPRLEVRA